ncbi:MAG: tetratricopeptide repeat protein [Granulosicoccus sp.]
MSPSTVRRERLVGPLGLVLLAGAFALAFFWLRPASIPGNSVLEWLDKAEVSEEAGLELDELDLAYIKAKNASGDISDNEVVKIILALLRAERSHEAQLMLSQLPALDMDTDARALIDLELAAVQSPQELTAVLRRVAIQKHLYTMEVLERAVALSQRVQEPALTFELYGILASHEEVQPDVIYVQCGTFMAARGLPERAARCYQEAIATANDGMDVFDIKLLLLNQLPLGSGEQQVLIDSLINKRDLTSVELERMARALLAVERPDVAYRVYARLALLDDANVIDWLQKASTWAQASNRPADAAVFLDSLASRSQGNERKRYLREIISVLVAAGQSQEAFNRVHQQLTEQLASPRTAAQDQLLDPELARGVILARQLGKTKSALEWNSQRLAFNPGDTNLLALQGELALAAADLPLALETAREAVRLSPADIDAREQLARVSEWNGQPLEASEQWLWLSDPDNQRNESLRLQALREVVRLSSSNFQSARAARALRELTLLENPDDDDVLKLIALYELEGLPYQGSRALNEIMLVHGQSPFLQRTLAMHNYKHKYYEDSLKAWDLYTSVYGKSSEASVYRMELLWRMDRPDEAADIARNLRGSTLLSQATDYQLRLLAEIAWRYDMPWLAQLVQPRIQTLEELDMRSLYGRRALEDLEAQGKDRVALKEAMNLWQGTGQLYFALSAMQLALKRGDQDTLAQFDPAREASSALLTEPDYWLNLASIRLQNGDSSAAREAYDQALKLDARNVNAILGVLWLDIADAPPARLQATLQRHKAMAENEPRLWQAMAVGYLELGAASTSVAWFEKLLDQIDTDYGMLLTYADALEYAGRAADARSVREYTVFQLRPLLAEGAAEEQSLLLRQYSQLAARYSGANHNEALIQRLMDELQSGELVDANDVIWREDLSISWLMSTQRHEQARVVMTNLHSQRIQAPLWQRLALALNDKDTETIKAILQNSGPLSIGNHILALRQLGNDREAYAMAQKALRPDALNSRVSPAEFQLIAEQYASLRNTLPSYVSGSLHTREIDGVSTTVRGISVRHSLIRYPLGLGIDVSQRVLNTDSFNYDEDDELGEVALSLFFGNRLSGGRITAGLLSEDERVYGSASWFTRSRDEKRLYSTELAYREQLTDSAELYLGARRNRASAMVDASLGRLPFLRLQADAAQINTRMSGERFADGLGGQAELGVRGQFASNNWSASVQAGQVRYQRSVDLPDELSLSDGSTVNSVLQKRARRLSVGASLSRGTVNGGFPQINRPRYFLDARLGHSWPSKELGLSLGGGGGIRVLGGDELSFSIRHDARGVSRSKGSFTSLGIGYRYHF